MEGYREWLRSVYIPRHFNGVIIMVNLKKKMTTFSLILVSLLFATTPINAEPLTQDAMTHFFNTSFNNLEEEVAQAKEEGKQGIFIMFSDPNCPWCMKMKSTIMNQVGVQDYYRKHFRLLHIDTLGDGIMSDFDGTEMSEKDFAFKRHRVRATPVFMIFDLKGKDLLRYTGTSRSAFEFNLLGKYIVSGAHKTTNFTRYKRKQLDGLANK